MSKLRWVILPVAVLALFAASVFALEVVLIDGKSTRGDVTMNPDTVFVKVGHTTSTIPRGSVKAVRLEPAETVEFEAMKATLDETAQSHYQLAKWLESKLQFVEAEKYYETAIKLDPDHERAREALGYKKADGKWTLADEDKWRIRSTWLGPAAADACYELAKIYEKAGDERRVTVMLRKALIANPAHHNALVMIRPILDKYVSKNKYRVPFQGICAVINDHNQHHRSAAFMQYGLDFQKVDEQFQATRVPDPKSVEDYYTWGAPILAAADGEVQGVANDFDDSPLGDSGEFWSANMVCIRHAGNEYTVYGHLRKGSVTVKVGQKVKAGDIIGRGGNSGSSGWPHMHWAMYDRDGIGLPATFVNFTEMTREGDKPIQSGKLHEMHVYRNTADERK